MLPFIDYVDMVLIMTVEPGFGGQKFMADMMPKVHVFHLVKNNTITQPSLVNFASSTLDYFTGDHGLKSVPPTLNGPFG